MIKRIVRMLGLSNLMSNSILSDWYDIVHFGHNWLVRMDLLMDSFPKSLILLELDVSLYIRFFLSNSPM